MRALFMILILFGVTCQLTAQTRQDTLRGTITPQRAWWDLKHYDLAVEVNPETKSLRGTNTITFQVISPASQMQIDLQGPLNITSVTFEGKPVRFNREGNVYWIDLPASLRINQMASITVAYEGVPVEAIRPPWDGGLTWSADENGRPFVATSCQGIGASIWWPCKDHMYDEPDSMLMRITVPPGLTDVSNGRLRHIDYHDDGRKTYHWFVSNPINSYGVNINVADYTHWADTIHGEGGILDCDYYVLESDYGKARKQFQDVHRTIRAFEYWFGPYPFYEDGFKLVQVPYLGMEHQSSVTYGNQFKQGYLGSDLSGTGWGLKWDFIIVHEAAHEWWANSITYKDIADMWIHESFANYAESLFLDYHYGTQAATEYVIGTRRTILNDKPIIGQYNLNRRGSGDMYSKGGNMLHNLRQWIDDDTKWRQILRGLQKEFYHQTVTTQQIEDYMARESGLELKSFFDQYLRERQIPKLEYQFKKKQLQYRYNQTVPGFNMPLRIKINDGDAQWIHPTSEWQEFKCAENIEEVLVDPNFYVRSERLKD